MIQSAPCVEIAADAVFSGPGIHIDPEYGGAPLAQGMGITLTGDGGFPIFAGPGITFALDRAFLVIDGVVIPVALAQPTHEEEFVGAMRRTFNGQIRSGLRRRLRTFRIVTILMDFPRAHDMLAHLQQPGPLGCEGLIFWGRPKPVSCFIAPISGGYNMVPKQRQLMSLEFDLLPQDKVVKRCPPK